MLAATKFVQSSPAQLLVHSYSKNAEHGHTTRVGRARLADIIASGWGECKTRARTNDKEQKPFFSVLCSLFFSHAYFQAPTPPRRSPRSRSLAPTQRSALGVRPARPCSRRYAPESRRSAPRRYGAPP